MIRAQTDKVCYRSEVVIKYKVRRRKILGTKNHETLYTHKFID